MGQDYGAAMLQQELQQTLNAYRSFVAPSPLAAMSPDVQKDWNLASGFQPYNLHPVALIMVPQLTPFRNMTPRLPSVGTQYEYKAVTGLNTGNNQGFIAEGTAASTVTTATEDLIAIHRSMAWADKVTFEQQWAGRTFVDTKAFAVVNLLRAAMISEENGMLFGQHNGVAAVNQQAPGAMGTPSVPTVATGAVAGTIGIATIWIKQTNVTGMGESIPSLPVTSVISATGSMLLTPTFTAGQPIVGFKFYWSATLGGTYSEFVTAQIATVFSGGVLPGGSLTWYTNGQAITVTATATGNAAPPSAEGCSTSVAYNGLYPMMFGGTGAQLQKVNGTLTVAQITTVLQNGWNNYRADYDVCFANAQESVKVTALTLGNGTPYYLVVNEQSGATANFRVARFTNPVTGTEIPIKVHPTVPQGTMMFLSTKMPSWYIPTDIPNVWAMKLPQDYVEIDYPPTQGYPYWQVEVRLYGTLALYIPGLTAAVYAVNNQ